MCEAAGVRTEKILQLPPTRLTDLLVMTLLALGLISDLQIKICLL